MVISSLPPEYEHFVQTEVASGRFGSPEEVVCEPLRGMYQQQRLAELKRDINAGIEELNRGEGIPIRNEAELRAFFDGVEVRGRQRLADSDSA